MPALSFVLLAKPTIGAALWIAYPSKAAPLWALALGLASVVIWPWWPAAWVANLGSGPHIVPPITRLGGPFILLALLRWRRPEARLLAALGCVPQSPFLYEAVPLFLVPRTGPEAAGLAGLTVAVKIAWELGKPYNGYEETSAAMGQWMVYLLYLPCVLMILARPNATEAVDAPVSLSGEQQPRD
jgi:hypothetical protein